MAHTDWLKRRKDSTSPILYIYHISIIFVQRHTELPAPGRHWGPNSVNLRTVPSNFSHLIWVVTQRFGQAAVWLKTLLVLHLWLSCQWQDASGTGQRAGVGELLWMGLSQLGSSREALSSQELLRNDPKRIPYLFL